MSANNVNETNEKKLDKIKFEILRLEDENAKTKNYTYGEMVEKIKQTIKDGGVAKVLYDGRMYLLRENIAYNALGQIVLEENILSKL